MNKRGVALNITTIIILILAILALVIIALYFTGGMRALWERIRGVGGVWHEADVTSARHACMAFCGVDEFSFCVNKYSIRRGNETLEKHCDEDPILAHKTPECKRWYDAFGGAEKCKEHRGQ